MRSYLDKANLHRRLHKIIGQLEAIDRLVDEGGSSEELMVLIHAARAALNKAGMVILEGQLEGYIQDAVTKGEGEIDPEYKVMIERFANMQ